MNDIKWDKVMLVDFKRLVFLTEDQEKVLDRWAKGMDIQSTATECHMTDRTVNTIRRQLRAMYDRVHIYSPLLPARK